MKRLEEIALRKAEIKSLLESEEEVNVEEIRSELDALEAEERSINEAVEAEQKKADEEAEVRKQIAKEMETEMPVEAKEIVIERKEEMTETRNSKEYIDAFAEFIKTGKDEECRALLSQNAEDGTVAVPELVYDIVKTAWDNEMIMSRVRKSFMKGNLKVGFEVSADDAQIHVEGDTAITPENLVLGTVEMVAKSIKKALQISDELYDLRGEEFLRYVYDELTYRIAKKEADELVAKIIASPATSSSSAPAVPVVKASTIAQGTIAQAIANLSDEANNPVVIMNKKSWGAFKSVQYAGNFDTDIFENLTVLFNNSMKDFTSASADETYAIVGDLDVGALANYPNGSDISFKFDENTYKKEDLIEVLGRRYVALAVVAPNAFVKITK